MKHWRFCNGHNATLRTNRGGPGQGRSGLVPPTSPTPTPTLLPGILVGGGGPPPAVVAVGAAGQPVINLGPANKESVLSNLSLHSSHL